MEKPLAYAVEVVPGSNLFLGIKKKAANMFAICHSCPVSETAMCPPCLRYCLCAFVVADAETDKKTILRIHAVNASWLNVSCKSSW